jgi:stage II sporulation protein M
MGDKSMIKKAKQAYIREKDFFTRSLFKIFIALAVLYLLSAAAGYIVSIQNPEFADRIFNSIKESYESKGLLDVSSNFDLFLLVFFNNAVAAFVSLVSGVIPFLCLSAISVVGNGFLLGVIGAVVLSQGKGVLAALMSLLPHGIVELPVFFYASSLGVYLMLNISKKILGQPVRIRSVFKNSIRSFIIIVVPLLLLAAFLEAYVTYAIVKDY